MGRAPATAIGGIIMAVADIMVAITAVIMAVGKTLFDGFEEACRYYWPAFSFPAPPYFVHIL